MSIFTSDGKLPDGMLRRVDNNIVEAVQVGVKYYADEDAQLKGLGKTVYFQHLVGNQTGTDTDLGFAVTNTIGSGGKVTNTGTGTWLTLGHYYSSTSYGLLYVPSGTGNLKLRCGSSYSSTDDTYDMWLEYTED